MGAPIVAISTAVNQRIGLVVSGEFEIELMPIGRVSSANPARPTWSAAWPRGPKILLEK
ncbi:MAG: hypothetical protein ACREV0_06355 [Burkholderiales bacterium]